MMDLGELEALYAERLPVFRRVAAAITGDREAGCDAVQEAFATAIRKRRAFRGEGSLEAWVWRIVVNTSRNARRRAERRPPPAAGGLTAAAEPAVSPRVPLDALSARQREVVFLRYFADLAYDEIARILGISEGTVGATLHAAHGVLRREMQEATA
jgi:DNA-directed RNA polymerase specialized sigma24 family protein